VFYDGVKKKHFVAIFKDDNILFLGAIIFFNIMKPNCVVANLLEEDEGE